ncbi:MAG: aromatic ring-hydroxylating dioxygenase subunit alpha [Ottowia sp.]|nr:aromatic ring-hydroxylating dioxygenase subunit alpha [Ottowia sp.]
MSNLSAALSMTPSTLQLPVTAYFDETLYQKEIEFLFKPGPGYVGHELMVPQIGDYHTLTAENEGRVLVRNESGITLLSNVCRHRQAIMLNGRGNALRNIVCPLHRWTYNLDGKLIGAPHFSTNPCLNLPRSLLQNWQGLLFEGPRNVSAELSKLGINDKFNFSDYVLDHIEVHECHYNWKTFIEVYLEDYHVEPFHPGLGNFVSCDDLTWTFSDWCSVQTVGLHADLRRPGTPIYEKWHKAVLRFNQGKLPEHGAIWLTYFPNVMVEWYPNVLVVSTLHPQGPRHTRNIVEFYYPEEISLFEREFALAERAAYMETCVEDDEIALRMDAGREVLMRRGTSDAGPYQSPMEDGMQHFHEWYRKIMHF